MRGLAVTSEQRMSGAMASVPTWTELGVDVSLSNWRGVLGPPDMTGVRSPLGLCILPADKGTNHGANGCAPICWTTRKSTAKAVQST